MKKGDLVIFDKNRLSGDIESLMYYKNTYNINAIHVVESVDIKFGFKGLNEEWIKVKAYRNSTFRSDLFIPATKEIRKRKLKKICQK